MMSKTVITLQWNSTNLIILELKGNSNQAEILRYTVQPMPEAGLTPGLLQQIWREKHFSNSQVIVTIPESIISYQTLQFPILPEEQLQQALRLELESELEKIHYRVINKQKQGETYLVKVAIIQDSNLQSVRELFTKAGLRILWLGFKLRGLFNFINYHHHFLAEDKLSAFIELNQTTIEFGLLNDDELLYYRQIAMGANYTVADIIDELRLSLVACRQVYQLDFPKQIWLFGIEDLREELSRKLETELSLEGYYPEKTRLQGIQTGNDTSEIAPLIGIALTALGWDDDANWCILTKDQQKQEDYRQYLNSGIKGFVVGILILLGLFLWIDSKNIKNDKYRKWIKEKSQITSGLQQIEAKTREDLGAIQKLEAFLELRGREIEFLKLFHDNLPVGTLITDITIEDGSVKNITGITPSVSLLLSKLQQVPELQGLKLKGAITSEKDGKEQFQLEGMIQLTKESLK